MKFTLIMSSINDNSEVNNTFIQPVLNIGMLGSVSDGKSTCVQKCTGTKTQRHSSEQKRDITIKPGYANMKIWSDGETFYSTSSKPTSHTVDGTKCKLVNHISFVDCPGHQELILTMLGSIKLMDAIIVVVSAAEPIEKKPQLIQHLAAVKLSGIKNVLVCLNKLDLIDMETANTRCNELNSLLKKFKIVPKNKFIIPTSFNQNIGIDWLLEEIMEHFILDEETNKDVPACFLATRSFDINKTGSDWNEISGGVIGGSLFNGSLNVGDEVEIRPGVCGKKKDGTLIAQPIRTKILSFKTDHESLETIRPGGLIGVGTEIDPYYCKDDLLSGNKIGLVGTLPSIYGTVKMSYKIIDDFDGDWKPKTNDTVNLQIGTLSISSTVSIFSKKEITFILSRPACIENKVSIMISHKEGGIMKIVAIGNLISGNKLVE